MIFGFGHAMLSPATGRPVSKRFIREMEDFFQRLAPICGKDKSPLRTVYRVPFGAQPSVGHSDYARDNLVSGQLLYHVNLRLRSPSVGRITKQEPLPKVYEKAKEKDWRPRKVLPLRRVRR
jgi:hypothetical protein